MLVKKLTLRFLKECLYRLSDLGVIDLYRNKHLVSSKKKIVDYVDNHFIPLIYFEESLEKLEQFLEKPKGELVYYSGNLQEDILSNYNKKQSTKLFKRMSKYRENEQLIFFQKKIDTTHGYYDYIVRKN
mgnify:CR=1 FL=1